MSELIPESTILVSENLQEINVILGELSREHWNSNYGGFEDNGRFGFNAYNCRSCGCIGPDIYRADEPYICMNDEEAWADRRGRGCKEYSEQKLCTTNGFNGEGETTLRFLKELRIAT